MRALALHPGLLAIACVAGLLTACTDPVLEGVQYPPEGFEQPEPPPSIVVDKDVDILFVIDNSGSMAEEQATLAANFASFMAVLERPEVDANYRIGITTTDAGNLYCNNTTTPERGALRVSSCRSRPEEFTSDAGGIMTEALQEACLDVCPEEWSTIELLPTTTEQDWEDPRPRSWIESVDGLTNLPRGLSPSQAFQCMGPQGIDGCGFESPLESMYLAMQRSETPDDPAYGFLRRSAVLSIVHVTDEADCSHNPAWESIFLPDGGKLFWSDPSDDFPSSAVCWNAGVICEGSGTYECRSVNLDEDGDEVSDFEAEELAVLHPVQRYEDLLQDLENEKQELRPDREVLLSIISGVASDGSVLYQDAVDDPELQHDFGIGPGCQSDNGRAVPPVRLRELAEEFAVGGEPNMFSICDSDYSAALEAVAEAIGDQIRPACNPGCAADIDPDTPDVLDPSCVLTQESPQSDGSFETVGIPECGAEQALPDGADVCYVALTGDALSDYCLAIGFNLEFRIVRREGVPARADTTVTARCEPSEDKATDCPELS